jgi:hypothetical protein
MHARHAVDLCRKLWPFMRCSRLQAGALCVPMRLCCPARNTLMTHTMAKGDPSRSMVAFTSTSHCIQLPAAEARRPPAIIALKHSHIPRLGCASFASRDAP